MMDPLMSKAQGRIGGSSKTASKGSSAGRKARKKKKRPSSNVSSQQSSGQSTGPSPENSLAASERSKSRSAVGSRSRGGESRTKTRRSSSNGGEPSGESSSSSSWGTKCASYTVGALHGIDTGLGIALIVYGAMVHVPSVVGASIAYGLLLALGALAGAIGYYSGACNRRGLRASAIAGFILCLVDIALFVAILASWDTFITFLTDNQEALMLSEGAVSTINGLKILFAVIFISLAGLEVHRGLSMWNMKDTMSDEGGARVSPLTRASSASSKPNWFLSLFGLAKRKKTDDFVMFDDNASMESSLLWSKNGAQATSDDYLEFVPEHERGLASFTSNVALPVPQPDKYDY